MKHARHIKPRKQLVPRRATLVDVIAVMAFEAWRDGTNPTALTYEGVFWAALRSGLILHHGLSWAVAHAEAGQIVGEGLRKAGGKRPSWREGQREFTDQGVIRDTRERCAQCEAPLEVGQKTFCSSRCASSHKAKLAYQRDVEAARRLQRMRKMRRDQCQITT